MLQKHFRSLFCLFLVLVLALGVLTACFEGDEPGGELPPVGDIPTSDHKDENDDGTCDECGENVKFTFDFFTVNDLHGKVFDTDQPGVDEMTAYLRGEQAENPNTVILSTGDMWQGSSESGITKGGIITDWMNDLGFSAMILGNHEFDWGTDRIKEQVEAAEFPILAINVYEHATNARAPYCAPSVMIDKGDVQVGIIGAVGDCYGDIAASMVKDVYFKVGRDLTNLVMAESAKLKAEGADFIVYLIHDGHDESNSSVEDIAAADIDRFYDINLSNGYVDLVFEAHTHQQYIYKDRYGVYHLQGGGDNRRGLWHVEADINVANGKNGVSPDFVSHNAYANLADDPIVEELRNKYQEQLAIVNRVVGYNERERSGRELRDILAKIYYEYGQEKWGNEYDIVLGGGHMSVRQPGYLAAGNVKYSDLSTLFPFDNHIQLCSISGVNLYNHFFKNGDYTLYFEEYGAGLIDTIEPNGTYYVVVSSYTADYAPNGLTVIDNYAPNYYIRDMLADYIEKGGLGEKPSGDTGLYYTDIATVVGIGNGLSAGTTTQAEYIVSGEIVSMTNTTYGNCVIRDAAGNELAVYGLVDMNGGRYDGMVEKPVVGERVTLQGPVQHYVSKTGEKIIELVNAKVLSVNGKISIQNALTIGGALPANGQTEVIFAIEGVLTEITNTTYGNGFIRDDAGYTIEIYGMNSLDGERYDALTVKPVAGDTVMLYAPIKHYVNGQGKATIELISSVIASHTPAGGGEDIPGGGDTPGGGNDTPGGGDTTCTAHKDADNNGKCDACQSVVVVFFDFYAINDLHGKLFDTDTQPGVDEMTTYLREVQVANANTCILSIGDMWQGSSESGATKGAIITDWMNDLGFSAMALGNHEFDWGTDRIDEQDDLAEFPFLAINVYEHATGARAPYCDASLLIDKGDVQIGVIGAVGDCYSSISASMVEDVYFKVGDELTALVMAESEKLQSAGADFIIYIIHDGNGSGNTAEEDITDSALSGYYDIDLSNGYVDLVFEAHTHRQYIYRDRYGVYHLQGGGDNGRGLWHAGAEINFANGQVEVDPEFVPHSAYGHLADDPIVEELREKYQDVLAEVERVLGYNEKNRGADEVTEKLAELYYEIGVETWGSDYDIVLGGGYLQLRDPGYLAKGDVRYADISTILPFNNTIQLCSVSGQKLQEKFFNNGSYVLYYESYGAGLNGNLDPNGTYYVVVDSYTTDFAPNGLTLVATYAPDVYPRDLLAEYIEAGDWAGSGEEAAGPIAGILTSIPGVYTVGAGLKENGETAELYTVVGTIDRIVGTEYGNMYIKDLAGNELYVYGVYTDDGGKFETMLNKPVVGDTVILNGYVKRYVNSQGEIIELVRATVGAICTSIEEALRIGDELKDNYQTVANHTVVGKITSITSDFHGNMVIEDANGNKLTIYGSWSEDGIKYGEIAGEKPQVGDTVILSGPILRYVSSKGKVTIELKDATILGFF